MKFSVENFIYIFKHKMMIRFTKIFCNLLCLLCLCCNNAFAVPAYPRKIFVSTFNGKDVVIYMKGDENQKFAITEDGYTIISDSEGWWYASIADDGTIGKSKFILMSIEDETEELKKFKSITPKGLIPQKTTETRQNRVSYKNNATNNEPIVGERRVLVILMQYKDLEFKQTKQDFEALFNELDYNQNGATGSVRDFYRFASQGQLDYISDIYGPYTSQQPMRFYGANAAGGYDANPLALCIEAIKSLPSDIDYSQYDNNNDGLVDNVHIIYAGHGEEAGASADAIWAHEYPYRIALKNEVGYSFASYSCSPELRGNRGAEITNIGVACHELGHALGAMDYYDTNYATGGEYTGTGEWDIMASGSWNDEGKTPPNFNPYVRSTVFGWNPQVVLGNDQYVNMPKMGKDNPEQSIIYRLETGSNGDYFLLENRQKHHFDAALPGAGLMIYHVHPDIERYHSTNSVNTTSPQGFYPVCASYSEPTQKKYGNINSKECPFPGSKNVNSFSDKTSPAAVAWNGSATKVSISNITMNSSNGSVSFTTGSHVIDKPDEPDLPTERNVVYKESFENETFESFTINSLFGKETWRTYTKGNLIMNADFIPEASDGKRIIMLHAGKGSAINESEAISSTIEVESGSEYILSFDICSERKTTKSPIFKLLIEDEYGEYNVYTLNEATRTWKTVEIPLTFANDKFCYKLYGKLDMGGIFIDNIQLSKESQATSIVDLKTDSEDTSTAIFSVTGIKQSNTKKGINIIRKPNGKTVKVIIK